jgi:hypothetical protein
MPDSFFLHHHPTFTKDMLPLKECKIFIYHLNEAHYASSGAQFAFWEEYFHKMKSRETLNRSHNDLNTTDNNRLVESFSASTELQNVCGTF